VTRSHSSRPPVLAARSALAALAAAAVLAACSGGGGAGEPAEEQVDPKQAYVEAATEVCSSADEDFAALTPPTTPEQFSPYVQETIGIADRARTQLAELTPPEQDRADLESKVLTPFAALVEQGKAWSAQVTAAGADQAKLLPLLGSRPTSAGIDKDYLRSYGLESCADAIARVG
jgi:hypothetical protein